MSVHSRNQGEWGVTEGCLEEVKSYFQGICPKARQLIDLPRRWKCWATADRDPIGQWNYGRVTLLGDAAHPTTQYMAQGACTAIEDAVTLGEELRVCGNDFLKAFDLYQHSRVARTARKVRALAALVACDIHPVKIDGFWSICARRWVAMRLR